MLEVAPDKPERVTKTAAPVVPYVGAKVGDDEGASVGTKVGRGVGAPAV